MNKETAKTIALTITNSELRQMFLFAKHGIQDWEKVSTVNKSMTKGTAWNILASDFAEDYNYHYLAKVNMLREFGEFLPVHLKPLVKPKTLRKVTIVHQEPIFK